MKINIALKKEGKEGGPLCLTFEGEDDRVLAIYEKVHALIITATREQFEEGVLRPPAQEPHRKEPETPNYEIDYDTLLKHVKSQGPPYEHSSRDVMQHFFGKAISSRGPEPEKKAFRRLRGHLTKLRTQIKKEEGGTWKGFFKGPIGSSDYYKVFRLETKEEMKDSKEEGG